MTRKQEAQRMLSAVNRAITEIASGAVSATITSGTGSKSYTRSDLGTLQDLRKNLRAELAAYAHRGRPPITMTGARNV